MFEHALPFFSSSSKLSGFLATFKIKEEPLMRSGKSSYNSSTYSSILRMDASGVLAFDFPDVREADLWLLLSAISNVENNNIYLI